MSNQEPKKVIKGLIVKEPYVSMIVNGEKIWEIRKNYTTIRGYVALISKGRLYGFAELITVFKADLDLIRRHREKHHATKRFIREYTKDGKQLYIWVFRNPLPLAKPIRIKYPKGARMWINLDFDHIIEKLKKYGYAEIAEKLEKYQLPQY